MNSLRNDSVFRVFIYLVNKSDIHAELSAVRFTPKKNEIIIVFDAICPSLLERLENEELKKTSPYHDILVYTIDKKEEHTQYVYIYIYCVHFLKKVKHILIT